MMELHPLCTLFPRMEGAEFDALVADIKAHGLRNPIITLDGMVLDGGNRFRACQAAGVAPRFTEFVGDSIVAFVLGQNLHRRHMTPGQQAAIVASAQDWATGQRHGGNRKSDQGATLHLDRVADRAAESGASLRTQKMADKVAKADPELSKQVARGEVSLPKAVEQVKAKTKPEPKPAAAPVEVTVATPRDRSAEEPGPVEAAKPDHSLEAEIAEQLDALLAEVMELRKVCEADEKLAEAAAVIKQLTAENRVLRERLNGAMNTAAEAQRAAKHWRSKHDKLEKEAARGSV